MQRHRHHRITTVHRLQRDVLRAGSGEGDTVPNIRQRTFADGLFVVDSIRRIHGQGHRDHRVATVGGLQRNALCTGSGEGNAVPGVRQCAFADGLSIADGIGRVDVQGHRDHGVATVHRLQRDVLRTGSGEGDTVPGVRQCAFADSVRIVHGIGRVDVQGHRDHGVTTVHRLQRDVLRTGSGEGDTVPGVRQCAFADSVRIVHGIGRVDVQGHRDHGVAAVHRLQGDTLRAGGGEGDSVPHVRQLGFANVVDEHDVVGRFRQHVETAKAGGFADSVIHGHGVFTNGDGDGFARRTVAPYVAGT